MGDTVYLVIGVPGSGKSWVCEKLRDRFEYIPHDDFKALARPIPDYLDAIRVAAATQKKPVLAESPFSVSLIKEPLEEGGLEVEPVFILADEDELERRWDARGNVKDSTRKGHLSRQRTYAERAEELTAFSGTSEEVLSHLKEKAT